MRGPLRSPPVASLRPFLFQELALRLTDLNQVAVRIVEVAAKLWATVDRRGQKLRSFGTFSVRSKRTRVGRNPKTGIEAPITARRVLTFSASPMLVAQVNGETIPAGEE